MAYSKNTHGELTECPSWVSDCKEVVWSTVINDIARPCSGKTREASIKCPPLIDRSLENQSQEHDKLSLWLWMKTKLTKKLSYVVKLSATMSCTSDFPDSDYQVVPKEQVTFDYKNSMVALTNVQVGTASRPNVEDWKYILLYTFNDVGESKFCSVEEIKRKKSDDPAPPTPPAEEGAAAAAEGEKKAEL